MFRWIQLYNLQKTLAASCPDINSMCWQPAVDEVQTFHDFHANILCNWKYETEKLPMKFMNNMNVAWIICPGCIYSLPQPGYTLCRFLDIPQAAAWGISTDNYGHMLPNGWKKAEDGGILGGGGWDAWEVEMGLKEMYEGWKAQSKTCLWGEESFEKDED